MGEKFLVTNDAVTKHATNLETSVNSLNANVSQFTTALEGLPAVWKGRAFQSFDQLQQHWAQAARDLSKALEGVQSRVRNAGALYDRYHADQQSAIQRVDKSAAWDDARFNR